jgi:hypothetical protein
MLTRDGIIAAHSGGRSDEIALPGEALNKPTLDFSAHGCEHGFRQTS